MNSNSDVRQRGGARVGSGPKPRLAGARKLSVSVDAKTFDGLMELGKGQVSAGVREAVTIATAAPLKTAQLQASATARLEELENERASWESQAGERMERIDPKRVQLNRFHGRHPSAFVGPKFEQLKQSMAREGGNLLPVLLCDVNGALELAYGSRRLHAALELGLPLYAIINKNCLHQEAIRAMAIESRSGDLPWSVFERGTMLRRCLDAGLYPSKRRMAEYLGWSTSEIDLAITAAELPPELLAAFRTPAEIEPGWVQQLSEAVAMESDGLFERAHELKLERPRGSARSVFGALLNGRSK